MEKENIQDCLCCCSSLSSIKHLHIVSHDSSDEWWLWIHNQVLLEGPSVFVAAHVLFSLQHHPCPRTLFSADLPVDVPNLIISSVSPYAVCRLLAWGGQVDSAEQTENGHPLASSGEPAPRKGQDLVCSAWFCCISRGIWKNVCRGLNVVFQKLKTAEPC